ncbi:uncharacterized protein IWZ02DRAFT_144157 [Phyllosticta citriasiana]|uniref:uncharacterized protein n=1 Tax=Phyllosticta citriasiana TaxID=595635 RepID=UPI0030FD4943
MLHPCLPRCGTLDRGDRGWRDLAFGACLLFLRGGCFWAVVGGAGLMLRVALSTFLLLSVWLSGWLPAHASWRSHRDRSPPESRRKRDEAPTIWAMASSKNARINAAPPCLLAKRMAFDVTRW